MGEQPQGTRAEALNDILDGGQMTPDAITIMTEWWGDGVRTFDHLLGLYREHRADCSHRVPWCTDNILETHMNGYGVSDLQLLLYAAMAKIYDAEAALAALRNDPVDHDAR